jgi:hypothetical protein
MVCWNPTRSGKPRNELSTAPPHIHSFRKIRVELTQSIPAAAGAVVNTHSMQAAPFHRRAGLCLLLLLAASLCAQQASAAANGRQEPGSTTGEVDVTDPKLAQALQGAKAAAGKPRLFHGNLVQERPLVQPDKW